jgi:ribonuclease-3
VNQTSLASVAQALDIGTLLRLGEGEVKTGGAARASILADAVESLIGAVLLDGGEAAALAVVQQLFADKLDQPLSQGLQKDAKTALQEWLQARKYALPQYMVKRIEGAAHQQTFFVEAITERPAFKAEGQGSTRRIAEQDAAHKILLRLAERGQQ